MKGVSTAKHHERRRSEALERQSAARRDLLSHARCLAGFDGGQAPRVRAPQGQRLAQRHCDHPHCLGGGTILSLWLPLQGADAEPVPDRKDADMQERQPASCRSRHAQGKRAQEGAAARAFYAQQLMQPEWLTDIPAALASSWCSQLLPALQKLVARTPGSTEPSIAHAGSSRRGRRDSGA